MDVLHHNLESIEASSFWGLYFAAESFDKVLVDNTIGCGEEGEDVANEKSLVIVEFVVPVRNVLAEIDFLCSPERGHGLFVHSPDLWNYQRDGRVKRVGDASRSNIPRGSGWEREQSAAGSPGAMARVPPQV